MMPVAPRVWVCPVELFGVARLAAGRSIVEVCLPAQATAHDLTFALSRIEPRLVGTVLALNGELLPYFQLNLNGRRFLDNEMIVPEGSSVLVLSASGGG